MDTVGPWRHNGDDAFVKEVLCYRHALLCCLLLERVHLSVPNVPFGSHSYQTKFFENKEFGLFFINFFFNLAVRGSFI